MSSFCRAAAALNAEYTLPGVSQTVIITHRGPYPGARGRAPGQPSRAWGHYGHFLSIGLVDKVQAALFTGAYTEATPRRRGLQSYLAGAKRPCTAPWAPGRQHPRGRHYQNALIVVGDFLAAQYDRSKLYDPTFTTEYRKGAPQ